MPSDVFLLIAGFPDSIVRFRGRLIEAVQAAGYRVHVAAPNLPETSLVRRELEAAGVAVHEIPLRRTGTSPKEDIVLLFHLIRLMRRIRPARMLAYTVKPVIYGLIAARIARIPKRFALITGLGYSFQAHDGEKSLRLLIERLYHISLGYAERVFFQNPDDQALFAERGILDLKVASCVVNGSGIDVGSYLPAPFPSGLRFLLIARLLRAKGIREYAAAAQRVRARYPGVEFALVGWIDDSPDAIAQDELDGWVANGTIRYEGRLADVRPAIAECSVFVLPTAYREGTPRTVLEAMAMGRAVITTDTPGCKETVEEGGNGFLVPTRSVNALEAAMLRFVDEPELVIRLGRRSREIAEEKYDVRKVNAAMLSGMGIVC